MGSKKQKRLKKIRLGLSVLAVFLVIGMILSGVMGYVVSGAAIGPENDAAHSAVPVKNSWWNWSDEEPEPSEIPQTTIPETSKPPASSSGRPAQNPDGPGQAPAQKPTAPPTQEPTQPATQEPTQPTEAPTQPTTPEPTQKPTQPTAPSATEATTSQEPESPPVTTPSKDPPEQGDKTETPAEQPADPDAVTADTPENRVLSDMVEGESANGEQPPEQGLIGNDVDSPVASENTSESGQQVSENTQTAANTETTAAASTEAAAEAVSPGQNKARMWRIVFWTLNGVLMADLCAILVLSYLISTTVDKPGHTVKAPRTDTMLRKAASPTTAAVHEVGRREYQQDSLGRCPVLGGRGMLAVVADGMGGLSGGEKVSQKIVLDVLSMGQQLQAEQVNGALRQMLAQVTDNVNRMLGPDGLYKSGSTVVAVLVCGQKLQWIAVGDSRIYLVRQGYANQLNRDHNLLQTWMPDILAGRMTMEEALRNPDGRKLTSFIGMGQLKYVDASIAPVELERGDRIVLMTDGVYDVISEERLSVILRQYPNVEQAAAEIKRVIKEANSPHQDNYTALILGF